MKWATRLSSLVSSTSDWSALSMDIMNRFTNLGGGGGEREGGGGGGRRGEGEEKKRKENKPRKKEQYLQKTACLRPML